MAVASSSISHKEHTRLFCVFFVVVVVAGYYTTTKFLHMGFREQEQVRSGSATQPDPTLQGQSPPAEGHVSEPEPSASICATSSATKGPS